MKNKPGSEGFWLLLGLSCLVAWAMLRGNGLEAGVRLGVLGLCGLGVVWAVLALLNLGGFSLQALHPVRLRRDSEGEWQVAITPHRAGAGRFVFARLAQGRLGALAPQSPLALPVSFASRGRFTQLPVRLFAPFPFGVGDAGVLTVPAEVKVLPRQVPAHLLNLPRLTSEFDRARLLKGSRDGVFKGIASYTRQHSLKEVNWKATARTGALMVNEYEGVLPSRKILVAPDPTGERAAFEWVLDFTYSLLEQLHEDWRVHLWCFDGTLFPLPANQLHAVEDYFVDLYPMGLRPDPELDFPGLKILVTPQVRELGAYKRNRWRICRAYDVVAAQRQAARAYG